MDWVHARLPPSYKRENASAQASCDPPPQSTKEWGPTSPFWAYVDLSSPVILSNSWAPNTQFLGR